jgi:hypothetical protein
LAAGRRGIGELGAPELLPRRVEHHRAHLLRPSAD